MSPKNKILFQNMDRKQKIELFKKEVKRCLLLSKDERAFWSGRAHSLADEALDDLIEAVSKKNKKMDKYVIIALMNDVEGKILGDLKQTIKTTKKNIVGAREDDEKVEAEEVLYEKLKNM